MEILLGI